MRSWGKITLVCLAVLVGASFFRDFLIKQLIVAEAKSLAGVEVAIRGFSMSVIGQSARVTGLKVYNPEGFPGDKVMIDVPEVAVRLDLPGLLKKTLHVPYLRLDLREARVVTNKQGKRNVESLAFSKQDNSSGSRAKEPAKAPEKNAAQPKMAMLFDLVSLNVGSVILEDYSSGKESPRRTVLNLNIRNKEFHHITSPEELGSVVMLQALMPTGADSLFSRRRP